ncbi:hypothetical protein BCV70DRAFT_200697 [Testicularia cyperi]|uniref:HIT-type domain-containing protein n=1 Tax=Testicularia cyperi TaxID=1882483 RepID=A0A317XPN3_9BASI|nr:hypothetical protein BCV70DRAFT_200697 [Testicularia cyperi]
MPSAATALCGVCNVQSAKYTCPRCSVRSCSLTCSKAHKGASGSCVANALPTSSAAAASSSSSSRLSNPFDSTRAGASTSTSNNLPDHRHDPGSQRTKSYIPLSKYSEHDMLQDYLFLSHIARESAQTGREILKLNLPIPSSSDNSANGKPIQSGSGRDGKPAGPNNTSNVRMTNAQRQREQLIKQLHYRRFRVMVLPEGMDRRRLNASAYHPKLRKMLLTVALRFPNPYDSRWGKGKGRADNANTSISTSTSTSTSIGFDSLDNDKVKVGDRDEDAATSPQTGSQTELLLHKLDPDRRIQPLVLSELENLSFASRKDATVKKQELGLAALSSDVFLVSVSLIRMLGLPVPDPDPNLREKTEARQTPDYIGLKTWPGEWQISTTAHSARLTNETTLKYLDWYQRKRRWELANPEMAALQRAEPSGDGAGNQTKRPRWGDRGPCPVSNSGRSGHLHDGGAGDHAQKMQRRANLDDNDNDDENDNDNHNGRDMRRAVLETSVEEIDEAPGDTTDSKSAVDTQFDQATAPASRVVDPLPVPNPNPILSSSLLSMLSKQLGRPLHSNSHSNSSSSNVHGNGNGHGSAGASTQDSGGFATRNVDVEGPSTVRVRADAVQTGTHSTHQLSNPPHPSSPPHLDSDLHSDEDEVHVGGHRRREKEEEGNAQPSKIEIKITDPKTTLSDLLTNVQDGFSIVEFPVFAILPSGVLPPPLDSQCQAGSKENAKGSAGSHCSTASETETEGTKETKEIGTESTNVRRKSPSTPSNDRKPTLGSALVAYDSASDSDGDGDSSIHNHDESQTPQTHDSHSNSDSNSNPSIQKNTNTHSSSLASLASQLGFLPPSHTYTTP